MFLKFQNKKEIQRKTKGKFKKIFKKQKLTKFEYLQT